MAVLVGRVARRGWARPARGEQGVPHVGSRFAPRSAVEARAGTYVLLLLAVAVAAIDIRAWLGVAEGVVIFPSLGMDLDLYLEATRRWLAGGHFFPPEQLAGPFVVEGLPAGRQPILYPPPVLIVLVPFVVLPAILYWVIPLALTALIVWHKRPSRVGWASIALLIAWPGTLYAVIAGNPAVWIMCFLALSTRHPAFGPWILLKPSLAPFALITVGRRGWWRGVTILLATSVVFAPMWLDYVAVLANARSAHGVFYSLAQLPLMLIPLIALVPHAVARAAGVQPAAGTSRRRTERAPSR